MIHIALTATKCGASSVICLELRSELARNHEIWGVINNLCDRFFDGGQSKMVNRVTSNGARVEIETPLAWDAVVDHIKTTTHAFKDVEWIHQGLSFVSLCACTA